MKLIQLLSIISIATFFAACGSGGAQKRIIVMASGKLTVNEKNIQIDPGFSHNEQELVFKEDKVLLQVESTEGKKQNFDVTENGVYVLNLQRDTLIGGIVNYGNTGVPGSITKEALDKMIDSTKQLMAGQNVSDAAKTYFLPPFTIKKITETSTARLVGSANGIPYKVEADANGKTQEVYKFFTNKQKRETLDDLLKQREKILIK
jgi:hypothetical protein